MPHASLPRCTLELNDEERASLEQIRDRDKRAYLRERAAALLKIAEGHAPYWVALHGLLKPRHPETVYIWLNAYLSTRSLKVRPACRRPFSPRRQTARSAAGDHPSKPPGLRASG